MKNKATLRRELDGIYRRFNRAEFIAADPLAPVLTYRDPRDQEVVALVSASLAFGNVKTILGSIDKVLAILRRVHGICRVCRMPSWPMCSANSDIATSAGRRCTRC